MNNSRGSFLGLIELDDYGHLVDSYGTVSAELLREAFFSRLEEWVRSSDKTRKIGDNRLLVVLNGISALIELELATAKLERVFKPTHDLYGEPVHIPIHAGFVQLNNHTNDLPAAVQDARKALRQAKKAGRLYQVFDPKAQKELTDETHILSSLERALDEGELQLYYQPKIHNGYNNLLGAEALIRWHTKDHRVLRPNKFIPIAERNPIIKPITWWAIKTAIAQLAKWPQNLSIAVNITPSLLLTDEIVTVVRDILEIQGVKPSRLTLEVTENIMVSNQRAMMNQLARLREVGVKISIDDFGTGYSSLSYFRNLPADELKIDKAFVTQMLDSPKDEAIVKAIIDLAHNFSLKVVAEGVEKEAQAKRLTDLGCDIMQGHLFDPPLPITDFERRHPI